MKQAYLLTCFLLSNILAFAQNCPPTSNNLQLTISEPAYCAGDQVAFSTNVDAVNYFWFPGQGSRFVTTVPNFLLAYPDAGLYEAMLVVDYGNNCQDTVSTTVEIIASSVSFSYESDSTLVQFQADTSQYITNYFWDFGNQLTGSGASVITRYDNFGEYPVTLYTSGICAPDSNTQFIVLSPSNPTTEDNCNDGVDNDGDGDIDCSDSDCQCDEDNDGTLAADDPDDFNPCVPDNSVAACQNKNDTIVFTDFPFLNDLVDQNNCTSERISVYQQGNFFYVLVETAINTKLYFQTGQFYCESTPSYDCIAAYNLNDATLIWSCSNPNIVDNDQDGTFSDIDPNDNDPCVPNNMVSNCIQDKDEDGFFSDIDPDDTDPCIPDNTVSNCDTNAVVIPDFYTEFPWLIDLVNPANCNGEKISIYDAGVFSFIYIETSANSILYFENGTFYCQSAPGFDCVSAYSLSNPRTVWTCTPTDAVDADNDGTPSTVDPNDDDPCIPDDTVGNCIQDKDEDGIFSDSDPDDNNPCIPDNTHSNCDTNIVVIPDFFTTYPWLADLVDPNNCTNEKITIYQSGAFYYIFVESDDMGILYFENGTFYCQSAFNFDCVSIYGLSNPITVWACNNPNIVDQDQDGVFSDTDPDDTNPCIPNENASNCIRDKDNDGSFSDIDPDDNNPCVPNNTVDACDTTVSEIPDFFADYPWLYDLVDPFDCNDEKISIYPSGAFHYIYIETATTAILYFETGAFYCQSAPNFDCLAAYNLTIPSAIWECGSPIDPTPVEPNCDNHTGTIVFIDCDGTQYYMIESTTGVLLDIYFPEGAEFNYFDGQSVKYDFEKADFDSPCALADIAVNITCIEEIRTPPNEAPPLFEAYTFLYNLVDPTDCTNEKVTVYTSGAFDYLLVETPFGTDLYFQDGSFFCAQTPSYNCVSAYGFDDSNITDSWTCSQSTFVNTEQQSFQLPITNSNSQLFTKAYPNPAQNDLWLELISPVEQSVTISLLDKTGRRRLQSQQMVEKGKQQIIFNLNEIQTGMYYLVITGQENNFRKVEKIVVLK